MKWLFRIVFVVAVAAVAAAIILPGISNSRGGGPRSWPARTQSDLRYMATGIEAFYGENREYPPMRPLLETITDHESLRAMGGANLSVPHAGDGLIYGLTTPVSFLTELPRDRFFNPTKSTFAYYKDQGGWILFSPGPDKDYDIRNPGEVYDSKLDQPSPHLITFAYDVTNGTDSSGDIFRVKQ